MLMGGMDCMLIGGIGYTEILTATVREGEDLCG